MCFVPSPQVTAAESQDIGSLAICRSLPSNASLGPSHPCILLYCKYLLMAALYPLRPLSPTVPRQSTSSSLRTA